jgi:hypothetical protein
MHHSFTVLVLNTLLYVSAFQNAIVRDLNLKMLGWCPMFHCAQSQLLHFGHPVEGILQPKTLTARITHQYCE